MKRKALLLLLFSSLLTSCGTTVQKINRDIDKNLQAGSGYLLIGIETNRDLKSINIEGPEDLILGHKDVNTEANFILVDVPAGEYNFEKIRLSRYWRIDLDEDDDISWKFEIKPNQISYIGDLEVIRRGSWYGPSYIELINRSSEALEFMEKSFPTILQNREIVYTGPGEDDFFNFVKTLQGRNQ